MILTQNKPLILIYVARPGEFNHQLFNLHLFLKSAVLNAQYTFIYMYTLTFLNLKKTQTVAREISRACWTRG